MDMESNVSVSLLWTTADLSFLSPAMRMCLELSGIPLLESDHVLDFRVGGVCL